jgi:hypothetical protein
MAELQPLHQLDSPWRELPAVQKRALEIDQVTLPVSVGHDHG